jgi:ubiquitin-like-conjugating enzyme ATG3
MEYLKNKANNVLQKVATPFMGVLKESKFLEKGVLTPEEFILAGDQLTHKCPTWSWESGTDKLRNSNLPQDRQFLITRGIPCTRRIKQL